MSDEAMPEREARVGDMAYDLWDAAGRPDGGVEPFRQRARELVVAEDARKAELHRLFFATEQFPNADSLILAVRRNLEEFRRKLDRARDQDE